MSRFELLPEGGTARDANAHLLVWPADPGDSGTITSDLDAWLAQLGAIPVQAIDLCRVGASAYLADRLTPRRHGYSRTIAVGVHVVDPDAWISVLDGVSDLLHLLTGDRWELDLTKDKAKRRRGKKGAAKADVISLLSGGLDSFCGAVLASARPGRVVYLGHWDNGTVKGSQNRVRDWLKDGPLPGLVYEQIRVTQSEQKREASNRSRSFLFMTLAVALAQSRGARLVHVPENGFTSLNPPLSADRGGALSTRSTHPSTLERFNHITSAIGLAATVENPLGDRTKGQLVTDAAALKIDGFDSAAAQTLSCAKLDGRFYQGGNPNHHCGLCVPCVVRRGSFIAAQLTDSTRYLSDYLKGDALAKLRRNRRGDVAAVLLALEHGFDDSMLMALGPFPDTFDFDAAMQLCEEGFRELGTVPLG